MSGLEEKKSNNVWKVISVLLLKTVAVIAAIFVGAKIDNIINAPVKLAIGPKLFSFASNNGAFDLWLPVKYALLAAIYESVKPEAMANVPTYRKKCSAV